jgi:hypothetical protein
VRLLDVLPFAAIAAVCVANAWRDDRRDLYSLRRHARTRAAATAAASTSLHGPGTANGSPPLPGDRSAVAVGVAGAGPLPPR